MKAGNLSSNRRASHYVIRRESRDKRARLGQRTRARRAARSNHRRAQNAKAASQGGLRRNNLQRDCNYPAGLKTHGYVTLTVPPPFGSGNFHRLMWFVMQPSTFWLPIVDCVICASATPPSPPMMNSTATLP